MPDDWRLIPEWAPIFPIADAALLPRQELSLCMFEPRYRKMVHDALRSDGTLAIARLCSGYESLYFTDDAPIDPVLGIGRLIRSRRALDGKYFVTVLGIGRARIVSEDHSRCYRVGHFERLRCDCTCSEVRHRELIGELRDVIQWCFGGRRDAADTLLRITNEPSNLAAIVDGVAARLSLNCNTRSQLLAELRVTERVKCLIGALQRAPRERSACTHDSRLN